MRQAWIVSMAFVAGSCAAPPSDGNATAETVSESSGGITSEFHGSWTLVSWTDTNDAGETFSPYGDQPFGRIIYAPSGKMAVVLEGTRESDADDALRLAELETPEMRAVLSRFFAYSGAFTVDEEAGTVTHHIEAALAPGWVGSERVRAFELLSDDRIALRPREGTAELVWQRER